MLLPYASDRRPTQRPVVTLLLLIVTAALTVLVVAGEDGSDHGWGPRLLATFALVPAHFHPFTLLTYSFLHASFGHLLVNLFYLWVFGGGVEEAVGRVRYLLLYMAGGAVGGTLQWLVAISPLGSQTANMPIVGASAACAGLIGLYAVRYYRARLDFVGLPFRPHVVAVVAVFLLLEIGSGLWGTLAGATADGVAHWAHIGGFIFGLTCAYYMGLAEAGERAYLTADAAQAMDRGSPGSAIKRWEALLAREPDNAMACVELARAWLLLGDTGQATSHYLQAVRVRLARNSRTEAALLYAEMRDQGLREIDKEGGGTRQRAASAATRWAPSGRAESLSTGQLFTLGNALEELEQFALAAETLRIVTVRNPDVPEAETALLKVITLYIHRLNRREEGRVLAHLFLERYPHSPWRNLAEELLRAAQR